MDLQEFLLLCKQFEIPLSSRSQLSVFKRIGEASETGSITQPNLKEALKLLFLEVHKQKISGLELILRKRIKQINVKMLQSAKSSAQESAQQLQQINEIKAKIMGLRRRQPGDTFEDAIKWLGIDTMSMQELRAKLNTQQKESNQSSLAITDEF